MKGLSPRRVARALGTGLGIAVAAAVVYVVAIPYPVDRLQPADSTSLVITDRYGEPLRILPLEGGGRAEWVSLDRIPAAVIRATLAGEDHRFYEHHGVDLLAVGRAAVLAVRAGRIVSGASTLTMQLVRMVDPHPRTAGGKIGEALTALRLERAVGKETILEQYLNRAYYGNGAFGIEAAAHRYFGKPAAALSDGEAALLAVLPRGPRRYDPSRHLAAALERREHVLALMEARGWLDADSRHRAATAPLVLDMTSAPYLAPHFVDWVLPALLTTLEGRPDASPARRTAVRTTLDLRLQRRLEAAVRTHVKEHGRLSQAGLVVLDPATGAVRAMVGSVDRGADAEGAPELNITTTARHPGSTLKPFIYAAALEAGDSPASLAADLPGAVAGYQPHRRMRAHGVARYREALAGSFNLAAVDVLGRVGVPVLLERLRQAGLGPLGGTAPTYGLDLALGSARVRLVDLAAAYGFLVNGGVVNRARALPDDTSVAPPVRLFSAEASWLVMDMLADPNARRAAFGANLPLDLPFRVAAKTGTSSGFADTLAVAATREAVVAVWAGAFDGSGTKGSLAMWSAAPLARAALLAVAELRGAPLTLPAAPDGIVDRDVCRITGHRPGRDCPTKHEHFMVGHTPAHDCPGHTTYSMR